MKPVLRKMSALALPLLVACWTVSCHGSHEDHADPSHAGHAEPAAALADSQDGSQDGPLDGEPLASSGELSLFEARAQIFPSTGAIYLRIVNQGNIADRLLRLETAVATAQTHESMVDGDVMRMAERADGFEIPAHAALVLEPGGKHVMLLGPSLEPGQTSVPVKLIFERAEPLMIDVPIDSANAAETGHEHADHAGHG